VGGNNLFIGKAKISLQIFKDSMKQLYDEYSEIFQNDFIQVPISRSVVDITQSDDGGKSM